MSTVAIILIVVLLILIGVAGYFYYETKDLVGTWVSEPKNGYYFKIVFEYDKRVNVYMCNVGSCTKFGNGGTYGGLTMNINNDTSTVDLINPTTFTVNGEYTFTKIK